MNNGQQLLLRPDIYIPRETFEGVTCKNVTAGDIRDTSPKKIDV